jgi:hypothetical protein
MDISDIYVTCHTTRFVQAAQISNISLTEQINQLRGAGSFLWNHQSHSYSRICQHFIEPERSLPCSWQRSIQSVPPHPIKDRLQYYSPFWLSHQNFTPCMLHSCPSHPAQPIILIFGEVYNHAHHHAIFSNFILIHPSSVHILLSTLSQTPSVHVLPLMSETKFHTHTKLQAELWFCLFYSLCF